MKQNKKAFFVLKQIGIALALPVAVYLIMETLIFSTQGGHLIKTMLDVRNLIRGAGISAVVAFAFSMNLTCGRMDLSLGAQRVAGTIMGGVVAEALGLGGISVLVFSILFGLLFGTITGTLFVTLRIPPMVLGIGMACIYECVGFAATDGVGLRLVGTSGVELLSNMNFTIGTVIILMVAMVFLMTYTKFSYEFRAVQGSQQIARSSGIDIFKNVVICYAVAGTIIAISGVLDAAFAGSMLATMGLTSNSSVMSEMFPMMIGTGFLSKYINQSVGIVSAAVAVRIFTVGLTAFNVSEAVSSSITMVMFIAFLAWQANSWRFARAKADRKRVAEAKALRAARLS